MQSLYQIIKSIQQAQGSLEKQAILDANAGNVLLRNYLKATYDPAISYYVTKIPDVPAGDLATMDQDLINWLVQEISTRKISGAKAKLVLKKTKSALDAEGQELLTLLLNRSIGASVGDTMVLKAFPGLYFIPPYMRCASMDEKARENFSAQDFFYVQTKRDGSFAYLNPGRVCTRQGSCYPDWFVGLLTQGLGNNEVLVGEMEVYTRAPDNAASLVLMSRKEGNGVLNSILQGADESEFDGYVFKYVAWDHLTLREFKIGRSLCTYQERWVYLKSSVNAGLYNQNIELVECWEVDSVTEAKKIHTELTAKGLEGTVWKTASGIWRDSSSGTRDAVKVKVVFEAEFVITGSYEGTGKAKGMLGGIEVATSCGKLQNKCGSGFSDDQRKALWAIRDELPGKIVTLEANDITTSRTKNTVSLSLPIFIEIRTDRKEADSLERVQEQFVAAKEGRAT